MTRSRISISIAALLLASAICPDTARASGSKCPAVEKFAPGVISTDDHWEWRLTFTPERQRAFWVTSVGWWPGTREQSVIKTSRWQQRSGWSQPDVAPFSGVYADFDPFVSPDGSTLYFSSMRPVAGLEKGDMDLWMVRRTQDGWGVPTHLGFQANADGYDELYPSIDKLGNLYFARVKAPIPTEDVEIYRSKRRADGRFGPAEKLGPGVNTPERWEFNPEISPDGKTLLFTRLDLPDDLPDEGYGFGDLYVSRMLGGEFSAAKNLGPCINTADDEFHPTVLWERDLLFFAKDIGVPSDFYRTKLRLPIP